MKLNAVLESNFKKFTSSGIFIYLFTFNYIIKIIPGLQKKKFVFDCKSNCLLL